MDCNKNRKTMIADYSPRIFFLVCYVILIFNFISYLNSRNNGEAPHILSVPVHRNVPRQLQLSDNIQRPLAKPLKNSKPEQKDPRLKDNTEAAGSATNNIAIAGNDSNLKSADSKHNTQNTDHLANAGNPGNAGNSKKVAKTNTDKKSKDDAAYESLPLCPEVSPLLKGLTPENLKNVSSVEYLESILPFMSAGGHRPTDCRAREKLAIIIPYRDRWVHLLIQIKNLAPLLLRQQADYKIYVIDQIEGHLFNKAMLLNIGYLEANKDHPFDCYVFQDVDMVPRNDHCTYRCGDVPIHLCANVSKWADVGGIPYDKYFGGAMAYSDKQWTDMNGASTLYFGWGLEDDDVRERSRNRGYKDRHFPKTDCYYDNIPHTRDTGNTVNVDRDIHRKSWHSRQAHEGLNTMRYKVISKTVSKLFTWVSIDIDQHDVLKHAPDFLLKDMAVMYNMPDIVKNKPV